MNINEYIDLLSQLKPDEDLLLKAGFSKIPNDIIKNYKPDRKVTNENDENESGDIIELFRRYDLWYFRFSDFSFHNEIEFLNGSYVFAGSSGTELAFKDPASEVFEYDRDEGSLINFCAVNTDAFLFALLPLFEMYCLRLQKLINRHDVEANSDYLEKCVQAAGGKKYERFYKSIIL